MQVSPFFMTLALFGHTIGVETNRSPHLDINKILLKVMLLDLRLISGQPARCDPDCGKDVVGGPFRVKNA